MLNPLSSRLMSQSPIPWVKTERKGASPRLKPRTPAARAVPLNEERNGMARTVLSGLILVLVWSVGPTGALADGAPPAQKSHESEATPEQQRTVTAAIYLLVALTMGAVTLLILVMLWGARVRRQARAPLAATSPNDPLWYLKKSAHPPQGEPNPADGVSDETTDTNKPSETDSSD